jgi:hypothetical protein
MNTIKKLSLFTLLLSALSTHAEIEYNTLKVRGGAFIPQSNRFRQIFGTAGGMGELEAAVGLTEYFAFWGNFNWFSKHGHTPGLFNPTRVRIANFSFGLQFPWQANDYTIVYTGLGPTIGKVWLKTDLLSTIPTTMKSSHTCFGAVVKTGIYWIIDDEQDTFIDTFADYVYQPGGFCSGVNIGGLRVGLGIGVIF